MKKFFLLPLVLFVFVAITSVEAQSQMAVQAISLEKFAPLDEESVGTSTPWELFVTSAGERLIATAEKVNVCQRKYWRKYHPQYDFSRGGCASDEFPYDVRVDPSGETVAIEPLGISVNDDKVTFTLYQTWRVDGTYQSLDQPAVLPPPIGNSSVPIVEGCNPDDGWRSSPKQAHAWSRITWRGMDLIIVSHALPYRCQGVVYLRIMGVVIWKVEPVRDRFYQVQPMQENCTALGCTQIWGDLAR